ncbi:S8 family peptidase [Dyadobacter pollutisoli]|uniref:S8/S53 family peptidase n=1 Tax=Dyadobacter pollutisoli TaxID=2910158 RepID=A0A9E8NAN7_9BACT|nr:S8/S53 family peptidase [Dyadobacter pollutisoli]WAC12443.1 S8/S53 family peptidase [Dyadobacter pollutisoli]
MKVTVKERNLNVRASRPRLDAPTYQFLPPGSEIEVDGKLYQGDMFEGIDTWLRDDGDCYYWSGGVLPRIIAPIERAILPKSLNNLVERIIIQNQSLIKGSGENFIIGILDSGIDFRHKSLENALIGNEENNLKGADPSLTNPHGTNVAGIMVGNEGFITGISPGSQIRSFKITDSNGNIESNALKTSLDSIVKAGNIDILNFSFDLSKSEVVGLSENIKRIISQGTVIIAAGNKSGVNENVLNPLSLINEIILVGAFSNFSNIDVIRKVNVFFLNRQITTTGIFDIDPISTLSNSSAYCPIICGLVARFLSTNDIQRSNRISRVKDFLAQNSFVISDSIEPFKMYRA